MFFQYYETRISPICQSHFTHERVVNMKVLYYLVSIRFRNTQVYVRKFLSHLFILAFFLF